ncbi:motility associated factor glycosyltransferase family protein [Halolactibacillus sp. JCM 19043]|uniref:motility associated factor glycosyltransferase family protein n=1 Tax=Halolactibacillus sp. JCM 19043 TaxID=1460638 RepID=UPI000782A43F|nr:6-hydroxymethylpterin diphosphokinase MptE-like protein [Halolactibacillus sp. JCM 19043]
MIVEVIETKNKQETLKVKLEDRELFIHSSYNPEREAQHILKKELTQDFNSDTHVVFLGLGLGYHVSQFTKQYQQNSYSIIEPSLEIFNVASDLIQLEEVFNKNVAHLFVGEMYSVRQIVDQIYKESATRVEIVISPTYKQLFSKLINEFVSESKKMIRQKRSELATNYNFQFNWIENSIKNHKHVLNTPNILDDSFKERFSDKPVIIVSAGPSLSDDIESIRSIKQNNLAYIFSVGSAINTLITYDVIPDAVFSYDPGDKNHLVFEKMIDQDKDAIPLVYGSSVGHQLLENFRGPKYHFITSQDYTSRLLLGDQIGKNELVLDSPSIAVMTFQIVNKLGMSPIIFAGQNLGYLYNRRYAQGVDYDFIDSELTEQEVDHAEEVKDVYGNNIKTNIGFNSMRNALVQFASTFKGEYYNTTKGGAAIEGIPFKTIEDLLNDNLQQSIDKKIWPINKNHMICQTMIRRKKISSYHMKVS